MKKRRPLSTARRGKRPPTSEPMPLGLRSIFAAMQTPQYHKFFGPTRPEHFAGALDALTAEQPQAFRDFLTNAADRDNPGLTFGPHGDAAASEVPEVAALSAFWAGVAACWYCMAAINGRDVEP